MSDETTPLFIQSKLSLITKYSYGVGHVLNDLCASIWFSYLLVYFHNVLQFNNLYAGYIMLIGQIADGVVTPLVGYEVDNYRGCTRYGKRKSWHLIGSLCVLVSFPFIFTPCLVCNHSSDYARLIYFAPFVVIFQFGWATSQISHLSLIPHLTDDEHTRVSLNAIRYIFTVLSSITVYSIAWILFGSDNSSISSLTTNDHQNFMILVACVLSIGFVFSGLFHIGTKENIDSSLSVNESPEESDTQISSFHWFRNYRFYQVLLLYMFSRLIVNIPQVYLPIYLLSSLDLTKQYIAIIPLMVFISGFITTLFVKKLNSTVGRRLSLVVGLLICIGYSIWIYFLRIPKGTTFSFGHMIPVFVIAAMIGAASSIILVTALAITADLIGDKSESGAFVYGVMSFSDKISNGVVILLIQSMQPCKTSVCCPDCVWYYRQVMCFSPGGVAICALLVLVTLKSSRNNSASLSPRLIEEGNISGRSVTS